MSEGTRQPESHQPPAAESVDMPEATAWPLVLGVGVALLAAGLATHLVLSLVGGVLLVFGLAGWIGQLLPGRGHVHEPLAEPALRPPPIAGAPGTVEQLRPGMPGHRFRLPEKVHPISAGVKGGIVGGLVMPIPAFAYGILSGQGIWLPINLLAGMALPGIDDLPVEELRQFRPAFFLLAIFIHAVISLIIGLMYGVLLPTFPNIAGGPLVFGGLIMPLLWTGASYGLMGVLNPALRQHVDWNWFIISQLVFGVAAAIVVTRSERVAVQPAGRMTE
jgi:uncharacterized membrane protein YagU involved in acid resistance